MTEFISTCSMPLAIVFLIAGFFFLVKGADVFVEGSSSIAKRFHVPAIIIGLTIVAMGTSLPETAVSVVAAIQHKNTLAISNVVGSNIFNMMVVIGFCAIMTPVAVQKATLKRDFPYSVFAALLLLVLGGAHSFCSAPWLFLPPLLTRSPVSGTPLPAPSNTGSAIFSCYSLLVIKPCYPFRSNCTDSDASTASTTFRAWASISISATKAMTCSRSCAGTCSALRLILR